MSRTQVSRISLLAGTAMIFACSRPGFTTQPPSINKDGATTPSGELSPAIIGQQGTAFQSGSSAAVVYQTQPRPDEDVVRLARQSDCAGGGCQGNWYITLAHLQVEKGAHMKTAVVGINKLLNSFSYSPELIIPPGLPEDMRILKFDPKLLGWSDAALSRMEQRGTQGQYGIISRSNPTVIRGDWLAYATTIPEVYNKLAGIPTFERTLETKLNVNPAASKYWGVIKSDITTGPRILEMGEANFKGMKLSYTRSYDFLFPASAQAQMRSGNYDSLRARGVSDLIAGEFIWELPNGLQAYMLSGFGGQGRYDALLPVAVDSGRADHIVINGRSCIRCHAGGLNSNQDVMGQMSGGARVPAQPELDRMIATVNGRFMGAMQKLGSDESMVEEPIEHLVQQFIKGTGFRDSRTQQSETVALSDL